jgi:hypothetical protein
MSRVRSNLLGLSAGALWLLTVGAGMGIVWDHALQPGKAGTPPLQWPVETRIPRNPHGATIVLFAHPKCPCTRASLGELARILARCDGLATVVAAFVRPEGLPEDWVRTDVWDIAAAIPGVTVLRDDEGVEAARFGAATSGQTVLYDADGRLLFTGGITAARGHAGDNPGHDAIVSWLRVGKADRSESSVFGCPLAGPASASECAPEPGARSGSE